MFCFSRKFLRQTILTTLMALSMTTVVAAQDATSGSGQGQPTDSQMDGNVQLL